VILVFDVGGTNTRIALAESGALHEVVRMPTDKSAAGFAKFLGALQEVASGKKITAVAGGFPGQFKGENAEFVIASNLKDWLGQQVGARLEELFDCPVVVINDVELCGLGEAHVGAGRAEGVMAYFTVSTGVNGVRIVDGKVDQSVGRYEMGHQIIHQPASGPQTLEDLVGGASLEKATGKHPRDIKDAAVWSRLEHYLAVGLYNCVHYWNPGVIVLGGSMMRDIKIDGVRKELDQMPPLYDRWPELVSAELGDEAGLHGAVISALQKGYK
jgi:predicted NBD/HSP70 family sugar kinase